MTEWNRGEDADEPPLHSCCTLCSILGRCISFVMKSTEGSDFKLISRTQRPSLLILALIRDAQRAETSTVHTQLFIFA